MFLKSARKRSGKHLTITGFYCLIFLVTFFLYNTVISVLNQSSYSYGDKTLIYIVLINSALASIRNVSAIAFLVSLVISLLIDKNSTALLFFSLKGGRRIHLLIGFLILSFLISLGDHFYQDVFSTKIVDRVLKFYKQQSYTRFSKLFTPGYFNRIDHNTYVFYEQQAANVYKNFKVFLIKEYKLRVLISCDTAKDNGAVLDVHDCYLINIGQTGRIISCIYNPSQRINKSEYLTADWKQNRYFQNQNIMVKRVYSYKSRFAQWALFLSMLLIFLFSFRIPRYYPRVLISSVIYILLRLYEYL